MKKRRKRTLIKIFIFICCVIILSFSLYISSEKVLEEIAVKKYSSVISTASYRAIDSVMENDYDYKSLVKTQQNNDGDIIMLMTDSYVVNKLATEIANTAFKILKEECENGLDVPLGAFSGIRMLSGFGVPINMKLLTVSNVKCEISSRFENLGINQTRHLMYINIISDVAIITKISTKTASDNISILAYDNLLVGKIPSVLVDSSVIGKGSVK